MSATNRYSVDRLAEARDGAARWAEFVSTREFATPYHTLAWKRAVEETFEYGSAYLLVTGDDQSVVGAVPGFELPETVGTSIKNPFCEYGFPLVAPGVDARPVLDTLRDRAGGRRAVVLKDCPFSRVRGYSTAGYGGVETGITHRLDVDIQFERLREDVFDDSLRRTLGRARETDAAVVETDDLDGYYPIYLETMRRLGSPQFPVSFFESLQEAFGDDFHLHVATADGEPVAGLVVLSRDDELYVLSNAALRQPDEPSYNTLVYASVVRQACESGDALVDFGRTEPGSGVDQFKSQFGGTTLPLVSFVSPPQHVTRASVSEYKRLAPITRLLSPLVTHPTVGPEIKRRIHE